MPLNLLHVCGASNSQAPRMSSFGAWSLLCNTETIVQWLLLGCELSLYAPYEMHSVFW